MRISDAGVLELAALARLRLDPDEVEPMRKDMDAILGYVETLRELDTEDVPPTAHVLDIYTPLRPDRVEGTLPVREVLRNAPRHDQHSMIVPKVIE